MVPLFGAAQFYTDFLKITSLAMQSTISKIEF